jgi:hypothetical protein
MAEARQDGLLDAPSPTVAMATWSVSTPPSAVKSRRRVLVSLSHRTN